MKAIIDGEYLLEKFEGKGAWTFVTLDGIPTSLKAQYGHIRVRGTIDNYELKQYNLMPVGDGRMFLPIKTEIRKKIKKEAGKKVRIVLYHDTSALEIPEELELCLYDEPKAMKFFKSLKENEQKHYVDWIYSAKRPETRADRIAETINRLAQGLKRYVSVN